MTDSTAMTDRARGLLAIAPAVARALLAELRPSLVLASSAEAALVGTLDADTVVVHDADGCVVRDRGGEHEHAAVPTEVVDATGAGDAFAAGFLLGGYEMALRAGARCVGTMGAMPR